MPNLGPYLQNNDPSINLRDYRHASRLYIDGGYDLMPKSSWLYYVTFEINSNNIRDLVFSGRRKTQEISALVKSAELPKFQINTEIMNQYNRKTVIQKNITYQPVTLVMHDDNSNRVNDMWMNYFRYYYRDTRMTDNSPLENVANTAIRGIFGENVGGFVSRLIKTASSDPTKGPYGNTKYKPQDDLLNATDYGLNSKNVKTPFFKSITIYQINRQKFYSYQLVNPIIKNWEHDKLDQSQSNKTAESKMTVDYETVFYNKGAVTKDNPSGFAILNYDTTPSPLGVGSSGFKSVFKNALSGVLDIFGDTLSENNPNRGSTLLDAINAVSSVGGLAGLVAGRSSNNPSRNTGYSTLDSRGFTPQTSLNGLGTRLNVNLGNNPVTANLTVASPIIAAPLITNALPFSSAVEKEFKPSNTSVTMIESLDRIESQISESSPRASSQDNTPAGSSPASGSYFTMPVPLDNLNQYTAPNVTQNSTIAEIEFEIKKLNTAWANDNDFVAKQVVEPNIIDSKLAAATNAVEFDIVKSEASAVVSAVKNLQETVNSKYQLEFERLSALLQNKLSNTSGPGTLT
jgi:hypothetical protein